MPFFRLAGAVIFKLVELELSGRVPLRRVAMAHIELVMSLNRIKTGRERGRGNAGAKGVWLVGCFLPCSLIPHTRRNPIGINIITLKRQGRRIADRCLDKQPTLGERVEGSPEISILINSQALSEPRELREVVSWGGYTRDVLLALDPDVDGLHVCAGQETVLGRPRLGDPVHLSYDAVVPRVTG
jgi:hypothetical protein